MSFLRGMIRMTEKRFTFDYDYQFEIYDNQTKKHYDGRIGCQEKLCDLLNSLYDENEQLRVLLKEAEDEIENLKKSNKGLMESIVEKDEQINKLKKEVDEYKEAIINKVQYYEDIEDFAIKKGLIKKDWAKFDGYD